LTPARELGKTGAYQHGYFSTSKCPLDDESTTMPHRTQGVEAFKGRC